MPLTMKNGATNGSVLVLERQRLFKLRARAQGGTQKARIDSA